MSIIGTNRRNKYLTLDVPKGGFIDPYNFSNVSPQKVYNDHDEYNDTDSETTRRRKKMRRKMARQQFRIKFIDPNLT